MTEIYLSYPEEIFELRAVVQSRNVCSEEQHGLGCFPPLFNHSLIKTPCESERHGQRMTKERTERAVGELEEYKEADLQHKVIQMKFLRSRW